MKDKKNIVIGILIFALGVTSTLLVTNTLDKSSAATPQKEVSTATLNNEIKSVSREIATAKEVLNSHEKIDIIQGSDVSWESSANNDGTNKWTGSILSWKLQASGLETIDKIDVKYADSILNKGLESGTYDIDPEAGTMSIVLDHVPADITNVGIDNITVYRISYE